MVVADAVVVLPVAGGAGSALMSFGARTQPPRTLPEHIASFHDLPVLLQQARRLGSDVMYLVDYWEGGYFVKGEYAPRADLGGPDAFRHGVAAVHEAGGRVIVYLEAFILSRECDIGRSHGLDWAMLDPDGSPKAYPTPDGANYYLMWPNSGFADYLASLAERMIADYDVDGFHLDSYGCQSGWFDHHPAHVDGLEAGAFDTGSVDLLRNFRNRVRTAKPDAVVMIEGSDRRDLLAVADAAQDWSLRHLETKPWVLGSKIFTSEFGLPQMERILALDHCVSAASWWLRDLPTSEELRTLRETELPSPSGHDWGEGQWRVRATVGDVWWCYDVLWANGLVDPGDPDLAWLRRAVPPFPLPCDQTLATGADTWRRLVTRITDQLLSRDPTQLRHPADVLGRLVQRAMRDELAI